MIRTYLDLVLCAVGHADALLDGERVPLVAAGAKLRPLALSARVRAVPALSPRKWKGPLWMKLNYCGFVDILS